MSEALLSVEKRDNLTKQFNKSLRRSGRIPAVYYIHGEDSIPLSVDEKELRAIIHSDSSIVDLALGKKGLKCVIRDVQWHPVSGKPVHVDFMGIKMTEKVAITVPIHLIGTAKGVKIDGGILQQMLRELSIECLPLDIPEHVEVDVSELEVGDTLHVSDINLPNVEILTEPEQSIVGVRQPTVAKEAEEDEVEMTEPERIGEKKEEEGEED